MDEKRQQMKNLLQNATQKIADLRAAHIALDITRGKPSNSQLNLSLELLDIVTSKNCSDYGVDVCNYGGLDGLDEMKTFFQQLAGVANAAVIVGGNSSLNMMHDTMSIYRQFGVGDKHSPWRTQQAKFICPVPGYDRHFSVCEHLNVAMIAVEMNDEGPDMDAVEDLVSSDNSIKGMWCVPKYSNPNGVTYSSKTINRLANMKTAAEDFRIFWDNAYAVHHLYGEIAHLDDILHVCAAAGNDDRAVVFASTSKITFAGAGVAALLSSDNNVNYLKKHLAMQTIGPDKINQLRHIRFFEKYQLKEHMDKHANLLRPRFDAILQILEENLGDGMLAQWTKPKGGYFISLDVLDGCAKDVIALCADIGVKLTAAGCAYPHSLDTRDRNIRIAPSYPTVTEVETAAQVLAAAVQKICAQRWLDEHPE